MATAFAQGKVVWEVVVLVTSNLRTTSPHRDVGIGETQACPFPCHPHLRGICRLTRLPLREEEDLGKATRVEKGFWDKNHRQREGGCRELIVES
jgi:hypothetical protein